MLFPLSLGYVLLTHLHNAPVDAVSTWCAGLDAGLSCCPQGICSSCTATVHTVSQRVIAAMKKWRAELFAGLSCCHHSP